MNTKSFTNFSNSPSKFISNVNWCSVCDVIVQLDNKYIKLEHTRGKRHQKNLKQIKYIEIYDDTKPGRGNRISKAQLSC